MCNHFRLPDLKRIKQYLTADLGLPLDRENLPELSKPDVFPNQPAPVLLYQDQKLQLVMKNWGYPSPIDAKKPLFNARIERFYESKPSMWDQSFARQRCIILADEFFEYGKNAYTAANGRQYKEQYVFKTNNPITLIAGIYDQNNFSMVTTAPNQDMVKIHDRMPLVIEPEELRRWLFQNFTSLVDRSSISLNAKLMPKNNR